MKKLLGLTGLTALLVLAACDGTSEIETVCTMGEAGSEMIFTVQSEGGEITSAVLETRMDMNLLGVDPEDTEEVEQLAEAMNAEVDGDTMVTSQSFDADELEGATDLDEFIENMEAGGGTCS